MRAWRLPDLGSWRPQVWRVFQLVAVALLALAGWKMLGHIPYRIDVEVYRMGAQAWLTGQPLYSDGAIFHTQAGLDLPFTYPPLAAIAFVPFAWLPFPVASVAITATTLVALVVSIMIVLTRLEVWPTAQRSNESAATRRLFLTFAIVGAAVLCVEPVQANLAFGQINAILMALVIADCLPRRTPWPRGVLLGLAVALKLTPAVFLLYFALRRDGRAMLTTLGAFVLATIAGFALAWRDSLEYWTATVRHTDRIGGAALNTNQNLAGVLARLDLGRAEQFTLWMVACFAVLGLTVWATRRVLRADEPELALMCVALFGLVVSPVSWSHHWVWALPVLVVGAVLAYRRRIAALAAVTVAGAALTVWPPFTLLPEHQETGAAAWRQLAGASYVWWALAFIVVAGITVAGQAARGTGSRAAPTLTSAA